MKITKLFLLFLFPAFVHAQTADDVIEKYLEATKATEDIAKVNEYKYNRSFVSNANTDYDEEVVIVADKKQLFRKKTLLRRDFYYVINGAEGWLKIPLGSLDKKPTYNVKGLSKNELGELTYETQDGLLPFLNFDKKGYKLTSPISTVTIDGKATSKLAIERGAIKREYYFDNATGLLVREAVIENGVTNTTDHNKYDATTLGFMLPVSSTFSSSRDKKKINVTTKWTFTEPTKGILFTKDSPI